MIAYVREDAAYETFRDKTYGLVADALVRRDEEWTEREAHRWRNGIAGLAEAVIAQWRLDGEPERDEYGVNAWKGVLLEAEDCWHEDFKEQR